MPFDPRDKVKNTTRLPAALRQELGLPAPNPRRSSNNRGGYGDRRGPNRNQHHQNNASNNRRYNGGGDDDSGASSANRGRFQKDKPLLKVIGKASSGQQPQQSKNSPKVARQNDRQDASSVASSKFKIDSSARSDKKRKTEEPPASKSKKPKLLRSSAATATKSAPPPGSNDAEHREPQKRMRINPFTGAMEEVKVLSKGKSSTSASSSKSKLTALEKLLAKSEAKAADSSSKSKGAVVATKRKKRSKMSQIEKDEEDEIAWLEAHLGKKSDEARDDLDDFLEDLDRFQVGMFDSDDGDDDDEEGSDEEEDEEEESGSESESEESDSDAMQQEDDGSTASGESDEEEGGKSDEAGSDDVDGEEYEDEDLEALAEMDFDSNDEADYSNWDAAMATTDEEVEDDDDDEDEDDDDEDEDENEDQSQEEKTDDDALSGSKASDNWTDAKQDSAPTPAAALPAPTAGRYIPPALRAKMSAEAAASAASSAPGASAAEASIEQQKLRRQAQGLLNRLGDANIDSIVSEFEGLYRQYSRAEVTSMITTLVLDTITARANLIDTYVILHAAFVAALHKVVGVEFAAFFVQSLVEDLLKHYTKLKQDESDAAGGGNEQQQRQQQDEEDDGEVKGKECLNLTVLACELYNLQVIACPLIYDLIRLFLGQDPDSASRSGGMVETDVELLLKVVRSSGPQLRHDDPSSLKAIITLTQERVAASASSSSLSSGSPSVSTAQLSSRSKFMLERLADLKNNRSAKAGSNDPSDPSSPAGQLLTRMKKFLGGMSKKRTVRAYDPLRISLKDLKDADKKGKWWLVGSAWTGQTDQADAQGLTKLLPMNASAKSIQAQALAGAGDDEAASAARAEEVRQREELLQLARKQGMNTEARRNVFVTILSAEDYQDAAQKLLGLKMNEVQRREIVRVLLHCVGSEKTYNPYYTLILSSISTTSHSMKITLQYCLWDFLREIGEKHVAGHTLSARLAGNPKGDDGDDSDGFSTGRNLSPRRLSNMAQTYAWLISRSLLHLHVLKPVDFMRLKDKGTWFLQLLLTYLVLSCQASNPAVTLLPPAKGEYKGAKKVERLVRAGCVGNVDLCRGLLWFVKTKMAEKQQRTVVLGRAKGEADRKTAKVLDSLAVGVKVLERLVEDAGKGALGASTDELGIGMGNGHDASDDDDDDDDDDGIVRVQHRKQRTNEI